jgi:hypothetical protein
LAKPYGAIFLSANPTIKKGSLFVFVTFRILAFFLLANFHQKATLKIKISKNEVILEDYNSQK